MIKIKKNMAKWKTDYYLYNVLPATNYIAEDTFSDVTNSFWIDASDSFE